MLYRIPNEYDMLWLSCEFYNINSERTFSSWNMGTLLIFEYY